MALQIDYRRGAEALHYESQRRYVLWLTQSVFICSERGTRT